MPLYARGLYFGKVTENLWGILGPQFAFRCCFYLRLFGVLFQNFDCDSLRSKLETALRQREQ
jgi:hypothetical protein